MHATIFSPENSLNLNYLDQQTRQAQTRREFAVFSLQCSAKASRSPFREQTTPRRAKTCSVAGLNCSVAVPGDGRYPETTGGEDAAATVQTRPAPRRMCRTCCNLTTCLHRPFHGLWPPMGKFFLTLVVLALLAAGAWWWLQQRPAPAPAPAAAAEASPTPTPDPAAVQALGEGLDLQLGREPEKALEKFSEALAQDENLKGVRYQMAVAAYQAGDNARAAEIARECISKEEAVGDAHILLGTMAARDGDHAAAAKEFAAAVEAEPANAMAYYNWSESLRSNGQPAEALEKLAQAMSRNPGEPLYALKQRLARIEANDGLDELVAETQAQVQLDPPAGDWLLTAAAIDLSRDESASAAQMLEGARQNMQPILFVGILQEDPFFRKYKNDPAVAPFLDVTIQVNPGGKPASDDSDE